VAGLAEGLKQTSGAERHPMTSSGVPWQRPPLTGSGTLVYLPAPTRRSPEVRQGAPILPGLYPRPPAKGVCAGSGAPTGSPRIQQSTA